MIDAITSFSVRNKWAVLGAMLLLVIWGGYSLLKLPIDAVPDITNKQVNVITLSPNLGPVEIERFITSPLEIQLSNIKGLQQIRSISKFGLSSVTVVFDDATDLYWARQQVFERLSTVKKDLPAGAEPELAPITTGIGEIYQYVIQPEQPGDTSFSLMEIRSIQDWIIRKNLLGTPGVADISSFGGYKKEYQAKLFPERLRAFNVTIPELFDALEQGNNNTGGAYIEKDRRSYIIRGVGLATTLEDIQNTVIKINDNVPVLVKDVANVELGSSIRYGAMTMDGQGEVVGAVVLLQMGENASDVIEGLEERMTTVKALLPEGLTINTFINRKNLVARTTSTVSKNLIEGAIVVLLVLFLFLGDIKASLIAASVIPLSMLFTFGMMVSTGVIGNLMSLGALDFGLIVDGSVIVVEGIVMMLSLRMRGMVKGVPYEDRQVWVIDEMKNIKNSVFFGTIIILIVYTPILFLSGVEGKMFRPMALTVSYAIFGALFLSLTYVPMMCAWILNKPHAEGGFSDRLVDYLHDKIFEPIFLRALKIKTTLVVALVGLLLVAGFTFTQIGGEFIPKLDEGDIQIETRLPVGTSLSQSIETSIKIEQKLLAEFPDEIEHVVGKIGTSEIPVDPVPMESTDIIISTKPKDQWKRVHSKEQLIEQINAVYTEFFPGTLPSMQQPIEARFNDLLSGSKTDVVYKLYGSDIKEMIQLGNQLMSILASLEGAKDVQMQQMDGLPQIQVSYNRRTLALYGITINQVNEVIETAFAGKKSGIIYEEDRRYDLVVRLETLERNKVETLENILIKDFKGNLIPLKQLAKITLDIGPAEIRHVNKSRCLQIGANVRGRDMESLVKEANVRIKKEVSLPFGYVLEAGGQYENLRMAKERLMIVVPIALIIILALLYASFGTVGESILVFTAVPMSAIGGIFALYITGINFSISAGVGFICLFGIAVLNGIMLIGHFKQHQKEYDSVELLVRAGVKYKFRPVLMTSAVAALGFMPMAIATGAGAEVQKPLATVVIGGLVVATVLTLIILPILYLLFLSTPSKK
ncbi:MAG: CusA/CzcA family heavy metal efflux RND transporter [Cytophagaceae bacterium]|nr:CusA/CzcA family heavy metal efflux RND transporter [Cytophagaceae bacterium]